jgi:hypothetical protein
MAYDDKNVTMEGVRLLFRNFRGEAGQFNANGNRNFSVLLDPKTAKAMLRDGWNVKELKVREDGDEPEHALKVTVKYGRVPPRVVMLTSRGRTELDESTIALLDHAVIINADLIVRPYEWDVQGKSGISAYLQSLYVTIQEDELELKYAEFNPAGPPREEPGFE